MPKSALQKKVYELQGESSGEDNYTQEDFDRDFDMYGDIRGSISANPDEIIAGLSRLLEASDRGMRRTKIDVGDSAYGTFISHDSLGSVATAFMGHWHPIMNPYASAKPDEASSDD